MPHSMPPLSSSSSSSDFFIVMKYLSAILQLSSTHQWTHMGCWKNSQAYKMTGWSEMVSEWGALSQQFLNPALVLFPFRLTLFITHHEVWSTIELSLHHSLVQHPGLMGFQNTIMSRCCPLRWWDYHRGPAGCRCGTVYRRSIFEYCTHHVWRHPHPPSAHCFLCFLLIVRSLDLQNLDHCAEVLAPSLWGNIPSSAHF